MQSLKRHKLDYGLLLLIQSGTYNGKLQVSRRLLACLVGILNYLFGLSARQRQHEKLQKSTNICKLAGLLELSRLDLQHTISHKKYTSLHKSYKFVVSRAVQPSQCRRL